MRSGRSYIEMLIALALLSIMVIPLFPALTQARDNQHYAILRHQAHSLAVAIVAETRNALYHHRGIPPASMERIETIINETTTNADLIFRITIYSASSNTTVHMIGEFHQTELPPPPEIGFSTNIAGIGADIIVVEVFDERNGNLLGESVGMLPVVSEGQRVLSPYTTHPQLYSHK